ncbi:2-hydroxyacid dehydrogenase [Spirochaeta cellobiosiphila]|uniref:2-hydroxyacid dehydrogenase n=1 Tax=Spirochaeta cellobiosiphila TaxID=504483 RepID=UPI000409FB91|nr:2-hydroxyacid dehydrogenase [Spirochaeta cellobiosiphila]
MKIAFFDSKPYDVESFINKNEAYGYTLKFFEPKLNPDTALLAKGYEAVCAFVNDTLDNQVLDILEQQGTKVLIMRCAGYNNVDLKSAHKRIHVLRVPAYSPYAVAEHALALIMTVNRKTHKAYIRTKESNFTLRGLTGFDMHGKTMGIIGTGKIGQVMIGLLKGFGMNIVAYDPYPNEQASQELGFTYKSLDELFQSADIISLHCPLTPETQYIIGAHAISQMKQGVIIINTGRGGLIDSKALVDGLKNRKIGAAGLDVYEEEGDYFFEDMSIEGITDDTLARLLSFPNVLITSHQAFLTHEALNNIAETSLDNVKAYLAGEKLVNEVCYRCSSPECAKDSTGRCF